MPKKLIFIGACARSGSSIFEEKLAADCGATVVGEIRWYWHRGVVANERCSCGAQFKDCEFWSEISTSRNRRLGVLMEEHKQFFDGARNLLPLYVPFLRTREWELRWNFYASNLRCLYREVFAEADCVLDSSKRPFYFLVLQKALKDDFEFWFISFSRDPRGVANSWGKRKLRTESRNSEPMTTYGPFLAGMFWNAYTIVCSLISLTQKNSTAAEYERFCENPSSVTNAIVEKVFDFGRETTVKPPVIHSVSGNPSRFDADKTLRLDEAWRKQPVMWRAFVRGITMPGQLFRWLAR